MRAAGAIRFVEQAIAALAALLLTAAALLQVREAALALWLGISGPDTGTQLTMALSHALSTLMIAEIIGTVGTFLQRGVLDPVSFLVVGIIASIRRFLVLGAEAAELLSHGAELHTTMLLETGLLAIAVALFAWAIRHLGSDRTRARQDAGA